MKKRIGFVDYNLDNPHANIYEELLRNDLKGRGFELTACTGTCKEESRRWAVERNVAFVETVGDLTGKIDYAMVLAPSNPEKHFALVKEAVKLGIPLYVDKTFAPDYETAREIFLLVDAAGVPMMTTSALRYTDEVAAALKEFKGEPVLQVQTWGGGSNYDEYVIHPLEWAISILGTGVAEVRKHSTGPLHRLELTYADGRLATAFLYLKACTCFAATLTTASQLKHVEVESPIFLNTLSAIMNFFLAKKSSIDRNETLLLHRIMDVCRKPDVERGIKL